MIFANKIQSRAFLPLLTPLMGLRIHVITPADKRATLLMFLRKIRINFVERLPWWYHGHRLDSRRILLKKKRKQAFITLVFGTVS